MRVRSAAEMRHAVMARAPETDAIVMAAAVADYAVQGGPEPQKIRKTTNGGQDDVERPWSLTLTRTVDILAGLGAWRSDRDRPVLVGFAAETQDVVARATAKLTRKGIDLVVANDVSRADAGFEVDTNAAVLVDAAGATELPLQLKTTLAGAILDRIETRLRDTDPAEPQTPDQAVPPGSDGAVHEPS